jgi:hypothetical protein
MIVAIRWNAHTTDVVGVGDRCAQLKIKCTARNAIIYFVFSTRVARGISSDVSVVCLTFFRNTWFRTSCQAEILCPGVFEHEKSIGPGKTVQYILQFWRTPNDCRIGQVVRASDSEVHGPGSNPATRIFAGPFF